jgi:CrcB protein
MRALLGWVSIASGGAIGSVSRYAVDVWIGEPAGGTWPWATFTVNLLGCLLIGLLLGRIAADGRWQAWRPFLGIGVLGGFTTYSAFAVETVDLVGEGAWWLGLAYVAASLVGGLAAVAAGERLIRS